MSLAEIEAELGKMSSEELRRLALKSWSAFVEKEGKADGTHECSEDDPQLLAALDAAIERAETAGSRGYSGNEVRRSMALQTLNLNSRTSPSRTR